MKLARKLISIAIVAMLGIAANVNAEPTTFDWSSTTGFIFSRSQAAIEAVTGQTAFQSGPFFVVEGSMNGQFTYDPANAQPPQFFGSFAIYAGANVNANSSLFGNSGLIGSLSGGTGSVSISDNGGGADQNQDVVNINHCCGADFQVGDWLAASASVVWVGDGFQDGLELPPSLPPADAPPPLGIFSFFNVATGENVSILTTDVDVREAVQSVDIDIKPGNDPNGINPKNRGVIPVAVLGSMNFDATQVDSSTVTFGPDEASPVHDGHVEDVNGDFFDDMVFHFSAQETGIACGDADAALTGETFGGDSIAGIDAVKTVSCK
jgi:hypothetical protein